VVRVDPKAIARINLKDTSTWPKPPVKGPFITGTPSRSRPTKRGEKSLFDAEGGEWRPKPEDDRHHFHWDYKPPQKNSKWLNLEVNDIPTLKEGGNLPLKKGLSMLKMKYFRNFDQDCNSVVISASSRHEYGDGLELLRRQLKEHERTGAPIYLWDPEVIKYYPPYLLPGDPFPTLENFLLTAKECRDLIEIFEEFYVNGGGGFIDYSTEALGKVDLADYYITLDDDFIRLAFTDDFEY